MNKLLQSQKLFTILGFIFLPIVLICLCELANLLAPETLKFPEPNIIFITIFTVFAEEDVWVALYNTFLNLLKAMFLSLVFGVVIGLFLGLNKKVWSLSQPTIDFFRSIPITFLIPAATLLLGYTTPKIIWILATYPCMLIIVFSVRTGILKQEPERIHSFYIICGSTNLVQRFFKVTLFEILPDIFSGFRIALSYCIVIITVLEYMKLGGTTGIGGLIYNEQESIHYERVYALTFIVGILGFTMNKSVEYIQNKVFYWDANE